MNTPQFLGIDVGGTKTAWGLFNEQGDLLKNSEFPTLHEQDAFIASLITLINKEKPSTVGIGIAGTLSADHQDVLVCTNLPELSHIQLAHQLQTATQTLVVLDNDARCALIGEVWKGAANEYSSAVMLTLGTGVGGAVMQKGIVRPHPTDVSKEMGRILVDPADPFETRAGNGTVEAFLGGHNLEERLGINLRHVSERIRKGDDEAKAIWKQISYYFIQCIRAVHMEYSCKVIIIGGKGVKDLEYYLQDPPPCPVIASTLGERSGIYGAARLAIDLYEEEQTTDWE